MRCVIEGQDAPAEFLAPRVLNFGQSWPDSGPPLTFTLELEINELLIRVGPAWDAWAREEQADIPFHEVGEFPLLDRWQALKYPSLDKMVIGQRQLLEELLARHFSLELLNLLLPGPQQGLPEFLVNALNGVIITPQHASLTGQAYRHPALATRRQPNGAVQVVAPGTVRQENS